MLLARLPYRLQIPLGLSLAVLLAALLVTGVAARYSARAARAEIEATAERAASLIGAQALPMLAADDTWRVFTLLRSAAALLPGADADHARAAVLGSDGRVFAASDPRSLAIGRTLLGRARRGLALPGPDGVAHRVRLNTSDGALTLIDPLRSEDGQLMGFGYVEIDAPAFATDWSALGRPALIGVGVAVALLVPFGWWVGRRMTEPVAEMARIIERIGRDDPDLLRQKLPRTQDPELGRISAAVDQLIAEMQVRRRAEQRALSAERMAAVGRMTAAVAHEINNPLGGLLNATQTLKVHGASDETRRRTLDLLQRGLHQIRATVAALLPQARIEDRPLEIGDLEDVATLAQPAATRQWARIATHANVDSAMRVPSAVMRQVMLNLVLNASKAAGERGAVQAHLHADADRVCLTVTNSGERLTRAALDQSITAESGNDPRGFGLWVCREIASQYAGGFDVDESFATGTRMVFWIPNRERHEEPAVA
jgi:two-component system NtrC family sensor kinase